MNPQLQQHCLQIFDLTMLQELQIFVNEYCLKICFSTIKRSLKNSCIRMINAVRKENNVIIKNITQTTH